MARTPLLRSLKQLLAAHQFAAWRGLPVKALREQRAAPREPRPGPMSRRGFLVGSTAALSSLAACRSDPRQDAPRIAIVGAGIAGLSAALTLADAGIPSTLYEASERVGGGMFTNTTYFDQGQVVEWYGEFIDSGHVTLQSLASRFGLELDDLLAAQPQPSEETFYFFGQYYPKADADRDFQAMLTLPFAVLRGLDYGRAGFDPLKHQVIQELGRGRQSKMATGSPPEGFTSPSSTRASAFMETDR